MDEFIKPTDTELTLNEWIKSLEFQFSDEDKEPPYNDFCFYL